ncbi:MAG: hypothetical protein AVDCRST_MAG57-517, partial [uncultured Blastococcus sp.]
ERSRRALRDPLRRRGPRPQLLQGGLRLAARDHAGHGRLHARHVGSEQRRGAERTRVHQRRHAVALGRRDERSGDRRGRIEHRRVAGEDRRPRRHRRHPEDAGRRHGVRRLRDRPRGQRRRPLGDRV